MKDRQRFRDKKIIRELALYIKNLAGDGNFRIMHVCGSHEHTITYWGLRALLPSNIELIPGPGCPVCVCAAHEVGEAIYLAREGHIIATFGDMVRDRTRFGSLLDAKSEGADVRIVYSGHDAVEIARRNRGKEVIFFSVGFETTAAPVASLFKERLPPNFSLLTSHKLTSPAVEALLLEGEINLNGLIAPGHVSTIVGAVDWKKFPEKYGITTVVAGFEPVDVLLAVLYILKEKTPKLINEYRRLVKYEGNLTAKKIMKEVFDIRDTWWRGMGWVPDSGLYIKDKFSEFDARKKFGVSFSPLEEEDIPKGCSCHLVVVGKVYPPECPLFGKICTPQNPYGPCMVSYEGACYIWHRFGDINTIRKFRENR
jgi:hydrogenase expression/formation protein HypD